MLRFPAALAVLSLAAMQVAVGSTASTPLRDDKSEAEREIDLLLQRILAKETVRGEEQTHPLIMPMIGGAPVTPWLRPLSIIDKPTKQSTTLYPYTSDKAVDGSRSSILYPTGMCSTTAENTMNPWWRVDLEGEHCITRVTILNRGDCCSGRLEKAVVRVGTSADVIGNTACGSPVTAAQAAPPGGTIVFQCSAPLRGRYVSVDIPGTGTLQLCEVELEEIVPATC